MRPIDADFLPPRHLRRWACVVVASMLVAAAAVQAHAAWRAALETDQLQDQVARHAGQQTLLAASAATGTDLRGAPPAYEQDAARFAQIAGFDVARVLAGIESARVAGVRVTSLEILAAERAVSLDVEWREGAALLAYVEALNQGAPGEERWQLQRVQAGTANGVGAASLVLRPAAAVRP